MTKIITKIKVIFCVKYNLLIYFILITDNNIRYIRCVAMIGTSIKRKRLVQFH